MYILLNYCSEKYKDQTRGRFAPFKASEMVSTNFWVYIGALDFNHVCLKLLSGISSLNLLKMYVVNYATTKLVD